MSAPATVLDGPDGVRAAVGTQLGHSDWLDVTRERVEGFARATGTEPGGEASGLLVLSLSNHLLPQIVEIRGFAAGVNYGTGRVRFPAPVPVGSRLRAGAELVDVADVGTGLQTVVRVTIEIDGGDRPAAVIDAISRWLP